MTKIICHIFRGAALLMGTVFMIGVLTVLALMAKAHFTQQEERTLTSPPSGTFVDAADARLFVQRVGDRNAPAVIFIHGTGSWSETWHTSMEQVASIGYQAIAIDLPPFGYSIPPVSGDYSKPAQARRILAALDRLGIRRGVFVAHSFGAAPVIEALMMEPQRATSIVLVDAALGLDSPQTNGEDNAAQRLLRKRWISETISATVLTNPWFTRTLLRSFISEKEMATPYWIGLYRKPLTLAGSYQSIAAWLPQLVASRGVFKSDDVESYRRITTPVTMIWGESDSITPTSQARHLRELISDAKLIMIPKAGHIPQIEEPQLFAGALAAALSRNPSDATR